jgi:hypothetical protein
MILFEHLYIKYFEKKYGIAMSYLGRELKNSIPL